MSISLLVAATLVASAIAAPPPTDKEPVVQEFHGEQFVDNFQWLEALETESDRVEQWTTLQNDHTRDVLDNLPGRAALEERMTELMSVGSISTPTMRGNLYFYTERKGDENQSVLYVRTGPEGEPRELLNPNTLDEKGLYSLDWYRPNHDGTLLAFGLSYAGSEMSVLYVMDVQSGEWLAEEIPGKVYISGWMPDSSGFLYGKLEDVADAYSRSFRFHKLGTHHRQDPLLFKQEEPSRIPGVSLTNDGRWFIVQIFEGWSKQDLYAVNADEWRRTGDFDLKPIAVDLDARFDADYVFGDQMYMLTTHNAPNGALFRVDLNHPQQGKWDLIIPEQPGKRGAVLRGVGAARGMLIASYQKDAATRFEKYDLDGNFIGEIELPGIGTAGISLEDDRTEAFYSFTSYNEPTSIYRTDLVSGEATLWARPEVPVDPSIAEVKQVWFQSADGEEVPMFIVHKKGLELNGSNPTLLYGYGGFNVTQTPYFSATTFPWLEKGGVYAVANLRGGGEYGEAWHRAGMLENKQNVFNDLYAAAEYLISNDYTSSEHLAVMGGSNGGLLTGVAATQRPDLFAAVVSAVPLLDMLRYHNFLMAKFWVPEYGSSEDPEQYSWLRAYSPYHNIEPGRTYPAILFTAGENDSRVHPLHARKMAAALQTESANNQEEDPILLWVDRESGHGQGKPLSLRVRDISDRWSFIMWQTGMYYGE